MCQEAQAGGSAMTLTALDLSYQNWSPFGLL